MIVKAISVRQVWAALIAAKLKTIETRKWKPVVKGEPYIGPLVIVSSLQPDKATMAGIPGDVMEKIEPFMLYGKALCLCNIVKARAMEKRDEVDAMCPVYDGAFSWVLDDIQPFTNPFDVKGRLGLYDVEVPENALT